MLLQTPVSMVEKANHFDPQRRLSLTATLPPPSLEVITTGEKIGPSLAEKVGNENDKSSLDADICRFKLDAWSVYIDAEEGP